MSEAEILFNKKEAIKVQISGTFNNWTQEDMKKASDGSFKYKLPIAKSTSFKFIVDDKWECSDDYPKIFDYVGNENNLLILEKSSPKLNEGGEIQSEAENTQSKTENTQNEVESSKIEEIPETKAEKNTSSDVKEDKIEKVNVINKDPETTEKTIEKKKKKKGLKHLKCKIL